MLAIRAASVSNAGIDQTGRNREVIMITEQFTDWLSKSGIHPGVTKSGERFFFTGDGKRLSIEKLQSKWNDRENEYQDWEAVKKSELQEMLDRYEPSASDSGNNDDEKKRLPVKKWLVAQLSEAQHTEEDYETGFWFSEDFREVRHKYNGITRAATYDDVYNWLIERNFDQSAGYEKGVIKAALCNLVNEIQSGTAAEIMKAISYKKECEKTLDEFLVFFRQEFGIAQDQEIVNTAMKHWMWMAKRRLLNREVVDHLFLNLYGPTGLGKSKAERLFVSPFRNFVVPQMTFGQLLDSTREIKKLTDNYILLFEELAINTVDEKGVSLRKDDLNTIKATLTGDGTQARIMGGQQQMSAKYSFACIGSANDHLYDTPLFDETTMRRYFEFDCTRESRGKADYDAYDKWMERINDIWSGVNEDLPEGYLKLDRAVYKRISDIQKSYYPTTSTTKNWIDAKVSGPGGDSKARRTGEQAYKLYNKWCRDTGRMPKSMPNWMEDIRHLSPDLINADGIVSVIIKVSAI